jgi:hypothetical protein
MYGGLGTGTEDKWRMSEYVQHVSYVLAQMNIGEQIKELR